MGIVTDKKGNWEDLETPEEVVSTEKIVAEIDETPAFDANSEVE